MTDKQDFIIKDRRVFSQETPDEKDDADDKQPETERAEAHRESHLSGWSASRQALVEALLAAGADVNL